MSQLPVIVAPYGSDVTQSQLDRALLNLIIDKIHELGHELTRIGAETTALGEQIQADDEVPENTLARAMRIMDTMSDRLAECRQRLQHRGEALQVERAKAAALTPEQHLRLSA